jgi:hypothetical protein
MKDDKHAVIKRRTMRMLRGYSKATLAEYLASMGTPGSMFGLRMDTIRMIELRNQLREAQATMQTAKKLENELIRRKAAHQDGEQWTFHGAKNSVQIWNRFSRCLAKARKLRWSIEGLEILVKDNG